MKPAIDTVSFAETPEGISINIRPAGFAARCLAFSIDALVRYFVLATVGEVLARAGKFGWGMLLVLAFAVIWLYPIVFELLPEAATPGKRIMGLKVMMANGLPITPAGCLIRNLLRAVDLLPLFYGFGIVSMLLRGDARRLGDLAAGTVVVYKEAPPPKGGFADGEPVRPPASLTAAQQAAVARFAWRAARLTADRAAEIASIAGSKTRLLVGYARWLNGERPAAPESASSP